MWKILLPLVDAVGAVDQSLELIFHPIHNGCIATVVSSRMPQTKSFYLLLYVRVLTTPPLFADEFELNFFDATTGKQQKSIIAMKDVDWDSWSLTLGWPVQGLWPSIPDGTDVVACDRSHSGMVVASSDTYGRVRLSRYPCVSAVLKHVLKISFL